LIFIRIPGFIIYDTQVIVERVVMGNRDFVRHAAELFVDVFGMFVRLLVILTKNRERDSSDGDRNKRRRR
jgi:FtsH-binding integral membrane protein